MAEKVTKKLNLKFQIPAPTCEVLTEEDDEGLGVCYDREDPVDGNVADVSQVLLAEVAHSVTQRLGKLLAAFSHLQKRENIKLFALPIHF